MNDRHPVLASLLVVHAAVLALAGLSLPWRSYSVFAVLSLSLALCHLTTAAALVIAPRHHGLPLRLLALASIGYQGYLAYVVLASALQLRAIHGALGTGLAAALGAVWLLLGLFTIPVAAYGLVATGGVRAGRGLAAGGALLVLAVPGGAALRVNEVRAQPLPVADATLAATAGRPSPVGLRQPSPVSCARPPHPGEATVLVTWVPEVAARAESRCLQGAPEDVERQLAALAASGARPLKIDLVLSVRALDGVFPHASPFALRGGEDGACAGTRCLAPWQLVASGLLEGFSVPRVDAHLGLDVDALRDVLRAPGDGLAGLSAIRTRSLLLRPDGTLADLAPRGGELREDELRRAVAAAEAFVERVQEGTGRFTYRIDPFSGEVSNRGFNVPRQAGTTLALCELGRDADRVAAAAERSLHLLAGLERTSGERGVLVPPGERGSRIRVGSTALGLVAFLACREKGGSGHDARIGRLARTLLALQRPDGSFAPAVDVNTFLPVELGYQPLYADGQIVLALVLLEQLARGAPSPDLPPADLVGAAAGRAMDYFGEVYRSDPGTDFFYVEENWHCLAARAALSSRRVDSYERFCLDYAWSKARFVIEGLDPAYEGGNGFGNVTVPLTTNTSGFGEALAASIAVARARGEETAAREEKMHRTLAFLVRAQLQEDDCFACARGVAAVGGFGASPVSPAIRIDHVQHAWAALGHGGQVLGLLPREPLPQPGHDPLHAEEGREGHP